MPTVRAAVCRHVADRGAAILEAAREEDAAAVCGGPEWRFSCGAREHAPGEERVWPIEQVLGRDPTAVEIVLHPRGTRLTRAGTTARWYTGAGPILFPRRPSRRWPTFEPRYPPRPCEPLDADDVAVLADVADRGWHTEAIAEEEDAPPHAFSVGLFRSFDHPEVVIFGQPAPRLAALVDALAERVRAGDRFEEGAVATGLFPGRPVVFRRVATRHYPAWLSEAAWYHGGLRFPAVQCVWPDAAGNFPWDRWYPRTLRAQQPVLDGRELA